MFVVIKDLPLCVLLFFIELRHGERTDSRPHKHYLTISEEWRGVSKHISYFA